MELLARGMLALIRKGFLIFVSGVRQTLPREMCTLNFIFSTVVFEISEGGALRVTARATEGGISGKLNRPQSKSTR